VSIVTPTHPCRCHLELLDEGVAVRNCWIGIPRLAFFEDLRRDPRFALFLERLGQPDHDRPI
jgi:hypothetical protein